MNKHSEIKSVTKCQGSLEAVGMIGHFRIFNRMQIPLWHFDAGYMTVSSPAPFTHSIIDCFRSSIYDTAAVGIDLGTTNSLVAHSVNQKVTVLSDESGKKIIPSVLAVTKDHNFLVGNKANAMRSNHDVAILSSIKRLMGKSTIDATNVPHLETFIDKNSSSITLNVHGKEITPVEVSAEILKRLKSIAEANLNCSGIQAVITVPAYFDEAQRQATKQSAELAGIKVLRIINEPTAAALAYGLNHGEDGTYAIYDFGGGTFDVSILRMHSGIFQVLATAGDPNLGGDDIDILIAKTLADNSTDFRALINQARDIKEQLSYAEIARVKIGDTVIDFSKAELDKIIEPLVMRTIAITKNAIRDAQQPHINGIVMVGGSTRIPLIKERLQEAIGNIKIYDVNPDEIVAVGAAIQAENLTKGSNNLLLDVTPLSLGIELLGGINEKIIHRNSLIPVSASREFTTHQDGQTGIQLHVVQGEREMAKDCRSLAHLEVKNIVPMKAGMAKVKVTFIIDADGLLTVEAHEQTTNTTQRVEIIASHGLSSDKIESMLRDAVQYSKEDEETKLTTESILHAEEMVFKIEQVIKTDHELLNNKDAQTIKKQIRQIKAYIEAIGILKGFQDPARRTRVKHRSLSYHKRGAQIPEVRQRRILKGEEYRHLVDNAVIRLEQISHSLIERKIDKYLNLALCGVKVASNEKKD